MLNFKFEISPNFEFEIWKLSSFQIFKCRIWKITEFQILEIAKISNFESEKSLNFKFGKLPNFQNVKFQIVLRKSRQKHPLECFQNWTTEKQLFYKYLGKSRTVWFGFWLFQKQKHLKSRTKRTLKTISPGAESDSRHPSKCQPRPTHQEHGIGEPNARRIPTGPAHRRPTAPTYGTSFTPSLTNHDSWSFPFHCSFPQRRGNDTPPLAIG
jgi:hypothetical protein